MKLMNEAPMIKHGDDVAGFGTKPGVAESAEALALFARLGCYDETSGVAQMMNEIRPLV
ncbi:hypothetical protein Tco_1460505, partial [Tanacetum coccineum]